MDAEVCAYAAEDRARSEAARCGSAAHSLLSTTDDTTASILGRVRGVSPLLTEDEAVEVWVVTGLGLVSLLALLAIFCDRCGDGSWPFPGRDRIYR